MRILVAVASRHGSTHEIAEAIAQELHAAGHAADVRNAGEVEDLSPYDALVFGSAIYAGSWLPQARSFAERHQAEFAQLPVWVFSSGPLGADDAQPHDDPARLAAPLAGVVVRDHRIFVGKLDKSHLGFAERIITKAVHAPEGDFRDWDAIRVWAREIAAALAAPPAVPVA